ncbi:putative bifunctional diguanylate cyclase/phosphodiesterase [Massilia sp. TN1-12]|uniref:putative bifunctional diguanylate cyclase/phosphodiesterase n=1 Tax=Massilia paldalensis TaxID=3377675 RepID=UPI003850A925
MDKDVQAGRRATDRVDDVQDPYDELHLLAPGGHVVVAADGRILRANVAAARMLGIPRAGGGRELRDFVARGSEARFDAFFDAALGSRVPLACTLELAWAERAEPLAVALAAHADGSGRACRIAIDPGDPAERLALLARSEERFRRIVHCADVGIWETDARGRIAFVNPRMAALLGCTIEDMLDRPLADFMDDEGRARFDAIDVRRLPAHAGAGVDARAELTFIRSDGAVLWASVATTPIHDALGNVTGTLALVTDITRQRASAERIWHQANYDELTGLPNRHMFRDRLRQEMHRSDRNATFLALLFIDLDRFKEVNDRLGHAMGDALLADAARRIKGCVRASDTLARLGGDEFTLILAGLDRVGNVDRIAQAIVDALARPFELPGGQAEVSASVGIALYPADARDLGALLASADQAMYASKNGGRNRYCYFTPDLQQAALRRQAIGADLRHALDDGQFEILYQPIVSLKSGAVRKAEALLRWRHPRQGLLQPAEFIPFAESSGLIVEIGDWVFREAARQVQAWQRSIAPDFQVSVNKSPVQFRRDAALYQGWFDYLQQLGLPPRSIVAEIGENVLMDGTERVVERLRQYRALGLQVALDHFGSGHGSLAHLQRHAIDFVKVDAASASAADGEAALVEAIVAMAHKLGLEVVAESVETEEQRRLLVQAGCDYAQGYVFGAPMTAGELEEMAVVPFDTSVAEHRGQSPFNTNTGL